MASVRQTALVVLVLIRQEIILADIAEIKNHLEDRGYGCLRAPQTIAAATVQTRQSEINRHDQILVEITKTLAEEVHAARIVGLFVDADTKAD